MITTKKLKVAGSTKPLKKSLRLCFEQNSQGMQFLHEFEYVPFWQVYIISRSRESWVYNFELRLSLDFEKLMASVPDHKKLSESEIGRRLEKAVTKVRIDLKGNGGTVTFKGLRGCRRVRGNMFHRGNGPWQEQFRNECLAR